MRYLLAIVAVAFSLSACAGYDATATLVSDRGAEAGDRVLTAAEWAICNAAPVGAVRRRYGGSEETAAAWRKLCASDTGSIIKAE